MDAVKKRISMTHRLRRINQTDLRQVILPMRDETREHLLVELADDMRELLNLFNRVNLSWSSWQTIQNR